MTASEALVSVVIPTHRRPALLREAVASALRQTHRALEVLVVDDAPQAQAADTLADIADPRLRCLRNARTPGAPGARNTGILAAAGEYIALLDDDDRWRADKIAHQLQALGGRDGILCGSSSRSSRERNLPDGPIDRARLRRGYYLEGGSSALLARAAVLKACLFDETLARWQDWDLLIRLTAAYDIGYMDEPLVLYNEGAHARITNQVRALPAAELERRLAVLQKHREFFGPYWAKRHLAGGLLVHLRARERPVPHLLEAVRRAGAWHVLAVGLERCVGRLRAWR